MRENYIKEEQLAQISMVRDNFRNDSLLDIQTYFDAFRVFYDCYLEGDDAIGEFFCDRWAESCEKFNVNPKELPLKPLITRTRFENGEGRGINLVLCSMPRAISCEDRIVNMFLVRFGDAGLPPTLFFAEQGGEGGDNGLIHIYELDPRPQKSDTGELAMGGFLIDHGTIMSSRPVDEANDFYNAVLKIICSHSKLLTELLAKQPKLKSAS